MVAHSWVQREYEPHEPVPFSVHEQDRAMIRDALVDACVRAPDAAVRIQLALCVSMIVKHDFPGKWPQVVDKISIFLQLPEPAVWSGSLLALYQLVKVYEYKKKEERTPLYDAMKLLLPQCLNVTNQCRGNASQGATEIRKQILKIFYSFTQYVLPLELLNNESFASWMEVCNAAIAAEIPAHVEQVDKDERPALIWWKEKKWALHIMTRMFERYGSPTSVLKEYKEFSEYFLKTWAAGLLNNIMTLLAGHANGAYLTPRVLQQAINYMNTGISHAATWKIVKPHLADIIKNVIFPIMSYTAEDAELWETDPYEYIRIKFDIFEDFVSPVTAAQTLLHSICKKRKDALPHTMEFLLNALQVSLLT